jgi:GNAT superfamily N-acetyltransferase
VGVIRRCHDHERPRILEIVNCAAEAYRDVIPSDRWQEPYMPPDELDQQLSAGVRFWAYEADGSLVGVMGIQRVRDVELIRHAYVLPVSQGHGVGGALLEHLQRLARQRMLVGTWAAAEWAIRSTGSATAAPRARHRSTPMPLSQLPVSGQTQPRRRADLPGPLECTSERIRQPARR